MRFVYCGVAVIATALAVLLWFFVAGQLRAASPPVEPAAGRLPVVSVLSAAGSGYVPGDALYDAQVSALRDGRLVCADGWIARRVADGGAVAYVAVETNRGRLRCP